MARSSCAELLRYFKEDDYAEDLDLLTAACAQNGLEDGAAFRLAFGGLSADALDNELQAFLRDAGVQAPSNFALLKATAVHCLKLSGRSLFSPLQGPFAKDAPPQRLFG